jgi:SAM-dependent methyltransferase
MSIHASEPDSPTAAIRVETERLQACPLCGSTVTNMWRTGCRDWQQPHVANRYEYERCARCAAYFLAGRPLESELAKVYFAGYGPHQGESRGRLENLGPAAFPSRAAAALVGLLNRRLQRELDRTYTPEAEGETLLDYGCGAPAFLDLARERGFATVGADFDEVVVETVRASGHEGFAVGQELERNVLAASLGCVRMNHVIEHLYQPREALVAIRSKMRGGGRIHISTPNPGSIGSRVFGARWYALDCPRHAILYRPHVLRRLLVELGFSNVSVVFEVGPKDLTRSWGILLYDRGRIRHDQIGTMAGSRLRSGLFLPVAGLGALLLAADRYHVFARA